MGLALIPAAADLLLPAGSNPARTGRGYLQLIKATFGRAPLRDKFLIAMVKKGQPERLQARIHRIRAYGDDELWEFVNLYAISIKRHVGGLCEKEPIRCSAR